RALAQREPGNRFTLLLGADAAAGMGAWFEIGALPRLAGVGGVGRPGARPARTAVLEFARRGAPLPRPAAITRTVEVPALDVSATMIRERVRQARSIRYLVPGAVRDYSAARGLYRT